MKSLSLLLQRAILRMIHYQIIFRIEKKITVTKRSGTFTVVFNELGALNASLDIEEGDCSLIVINSTIIGCREDGHDKLKVIILATSIAQLMRTKEEVKRVQAHESLCDVLTLTESRHNSECEMGKERYPIDTSATV